MDRLGHPPCSLLPESSWESFDARTSGSSCPCHTARQEELLRKLVRGTTTPQRLAVRAQIVLLAAAGHSSEQIVGKLVVTRRWCASGVDGGRRRRTSCVSWKARSRTRRYRVGSARSWPTHPGAVVRPTSAQSRSSKLSPCEDPEAAQRPFSHWTPGEVARESVRRGIIESISTRSVDRFLKGDRS